MTLTPNPKQEEETLTRTPAPHPGQEEGEHCWDGRRGEVVAGCFAGARNAALLCALRQVYCENAVLRQGGDLVFRVLRPPSHRRA